MSVSDRYRRFSEGVPKWVGWDGFGNFIAIKLTDITAQALSLKYMIVSVLQNEDELACPMSHLLTTSII